MGLATQYIQHLRCVACRHGYFAAVDGPLSSCDACGARHWQLLSLWDLRTEGFPVSLQRPRPAAMAMERRTH